MRRYNNHREEHPASLACPSCKNLYQYPNPNRHDNSGSPRNKESLRIPLILKCGHTYCRSCIEGQIHSNPAFFCPVCQVATKLSGSTTDRKISQLHFDFDMIGRLLAYRTGAYQVIREKNEFDNLSYSDERKACGNCNMSPEQMLCIDCDINYCSPCFQKVHFQTTGTLRRHVQIPASKSGIFGKLSYCNIHTRRMVDAHCTTCNQGVCYACEHVRGAHQNHDLKTYAEVFPRELQKFKNLRPRADNALYQVDCLTKKQRSINSNAKQDEKLIEDIRLGFEHLHGILQMKEIEIIRQCCEKGKQSSGKLIDHKKFLINVIEDIDRLSRHEITEQNIPNIPLNMGSITSQIQSAEDAVTVSSSFKIKKEVNVQFDIRSFQEMLNSCVTAPGISRTSSRTTSHSSGQESIPSYSILKHSSAESSDSLLPQYPSGRLLNPKSHEGPPLDAQASYAVVAVDTDQGEEEMDKVLDEHGFPLTLPSIEKTDKKGPMGDERTKRTFNAVKRKGGSKIDPDLVTGDDIVVIHIINPNSFYVQKTSDQNLVEKMFNECQRTAKKHPRPMNRFEWSRLEEGDLMMAQYSADMNWYRARVLEISESLPRKMRACFIDYGNSNLIEIHEAQVLSQNLATINDLAFHCSMNLKPRSGSAWKNSDNRAFHRQVMTSIAEYMIKVNGHDQRSDVYVVDLLRRSTHVDGPLSVREWLVASGHAFFPEAESKLRVKRDIGDRNSVAVAVESDKTINVDDLPRDATEESTLTYESDREQASEQSESEAVLAHQSSRNVDLPNNCTVRVSSLESLDKIWLSPVAQTRNMVFTRNHPALQPDAEHRPFRPRVGGLYGVRHSDGMWYRAVILKEDEEDVEVRSVDFGGFWTAAWRTGVVRLQRKYLVEHYKAHCLSLIGLTFENRKRIPSLMEDVKKMVFSQPIYRLIYGTNTQIGSPDGNCVYLVNENGCLNMTLVEKELADFSDRRQLDLVIELCPESIEASELEDASEATDSADAPTLTTDNPSVSAYDVQDSSQIVPLEMLKTCVNVLDNLKPNEDDAGPSECDVVLLCEDDVCRLPKMPPCHITRFESPAEFYVRMTDPESLKISEKLSALLHEKYCNVNVAKRNEDGLQLNSGAIVAVMRPGESKWYRGRVIGQNPCSPELTQILLVDFGDTTSVPRNYIINPLDSSLIYGWNEMSIRCHVMGIQANDGADWEDWVVERVEKILKRCDFRGQVSRVMIDSKSCGVDLVMREVIRGSPDDDDHSDTEDVDSTDSSVTRYISLRDTLLDLGLAEPLPLDEVKIEDSNLRLIGRSLISHLAQGDTTLLEAMAGLRLNDKLKPSGDASQPTSESLTGIDVHLFQENNNSAPTGDVDLEDAEEAAVRISLQSPQSSPKRRHLPVPNNLIGTSPGGSSTGSEAGTAITPSVANRLDISPPGTQFLINGPPNPSASDSLETLALPQVSHAEPSPLFNEPEDILITPTSPSENFSVAMQRMASVSSAGDDDGGPMMEWKWPSWKAIEEFEEGVEVQIRFVDSDMNFICEPAMGENLRNASLAIEERASGEQDTLRLAPKTHIKYWRRGEACLAFSEEKGRWCRAQIQDVNFHSHSAEVYFIDHGDSVWLLSTLICPIATGQKEGDHPYLSISPAVWKVKLHNIYPVNQRDPNDLYNRKWEEHHTNHISNDFAYHIAVLYVVTVEKPIHELPTVFGRIVSEVYSGNEVGEYLCSRSIAYRWESNNPDQLFVKSPPEFTCYPTVAPFPVGVPLEVIVTAVETPNELYLQTVFSEDEAYVLSERYPEHEEWFLETGRVNDYIRRSEIDIVADDLSPLKDCLEGNILEDRIPCVAKFSEDEKWYRAELAHAKADSGLMRVHFVDYGNYDDVSFDNLRESYQVEVPCGCRRYRWKDVKRHNNCKFPPEKLLLQSALLEELDTFAVSGLFVKCERIYKDGRLPLMDLYRDKECTMPIVNLLEEKALVQRSKILY